MANTKSAVAATHMSDWPSPITSTRLALGVDLHLQLPAAARQASLACGKSMRQRSVVDLAQAVGENRQETDVVACQDPCNALFDAVADHFEGRAEADDVVDEVGEVRIDLDAVEEVEQFGWRGLDQRKLATEAFTGTDVARQPLVFDRFPARVGESLEDAVDHVGAGDGPVEITHDMPVNHLLYLLGRVRSVRLPRG